MAAAGNDGAEACLTAPANVPLVITVGAYNDRQDVDNAFADFSNYGRCVDLWAPGTGINAALAGSVQEDVKDGTSMSAPQVAGAIALLRGLFRWWPAIRVANELLAASVRRSILDWGRALDVGR